MANNGPSKLLSFIAAPFIAVAFHPGLLSLGVWYMPSKASAGPSWELGLFAILLWPIILLGALFRTIGGLLGTVLAFLWVPGIALGSVHVFLRFRRKRKDTERAAGSYSETVARCPQE